MNVSVCIGCGCDDNHACDQGCWWIRLDRPASVGLCNRCEVDHVDAWDRGDRTLRAVPAAEREAIEEHAEHVREPRPAMPAPVLKPGEPCPHDWPYSDVRDHDRCRWCGMGFLRHVFLEMP
jgi:hypothetical protein